MADQKRIAVVPGDGIGPEVIEAGLKVLQAATERTGTPMTWDEGLGGRKVAQRGRRPS